MFSSHCLLGSVNCQFSTLRKKEVLVLNKDRIELAVQSLPNAKRVLFGEDFPSIASKQDDLSRSFAKNLGWASRPSKRRRPSQCLPPKGKDLLPVPNVNTKVPVQKTGVPFGPPNPRQKNRRTHSQVEGNNLQPSNSQHWVRLQDSVTLRTSSVLSTGYKPLQENAHVTYAEVESLLAKDAIVHVSPMKEGFLSLLFVISKKYGTFWPVIDLSFL